MLVSARTAAIPASGSSRRTRCAAWPPKPEAGLIDPAYSLLSQALAIRTTPAL
jgi:hypothetical protein